ncbi:MAG: hypothetical protein M3082_03530 [Candidatus Dormibacteraeota bacterium]|nr:hypothetical protein [Candidatus Dormibacteraeota bacterium]
MATRSIDLASAGPTPRRPKGPRPALGAIRYRVSVGRGNERVGEFTTRADALALIRELAATYGPAALDLLTLDVRIGDREGLTIGHGADLIDLASAVHRPGTGETKRLLTQGRGGRRDPTPAPNVAPTAVSAACTTRFLERSS